MKSIFFNRCDPFSTRALRSMRSEVRSMIGGLIFMILSPLVACGGSSETLLKWTKESQEQLTQCRQQMSALKARRETACVSRTPSFGAPPLLPSDSPSQSTPSSQLDTESSEDLALGLPLPPHKGKLIQFPTYKQLGYYSTVAGAVVDYFPQGLILTFGKIKTQLVFTKKNQVLTAYARFSGYARTLQMVNAWNSRHRFGRAYQEEAGDLILETEIDLEPGITERAIVTWIRSYGILVNFFQINLMQQDQKKRSNQPHRESI